MLIVGRLVVGWGLLIVERGLLMLGLLVSRLAALGVLRNPGWVRRRQVRHGRS